MGITRRITGAAKSAWRHGWGQRFDPVTGRCLCGDPECCWYGPIDETERRRRTVTLSWNPKDGSFETIDADGFWVPTTDAIAPWDEVAGALGAKGYTHITFEGPLTIEQFRVLVQDWRR